MRLGNRRRSPAARVLLTTVSLLVVGTLAACGGDGTADDPPGADPSGSGGSGGAGASGSSASGEVPHTLVEIVTRTGAGGQVTTTPTPIGDRLALLRYAAGLRGAGAAADALADEVVEVATDHTPTESGRVLTATVVRVGCGAPESVSVELVQGRVRVQVGAPPTPDDTLCEAPETSVALVELSRDLLPAQPDPERSAVTPGPQ